MRHLLPMLASGGQSLPLGEAWVHEVKWDGVRVLLGRDERGEWIRTRSGKEVTRSFPEVASAVRAVAPGLVLDAELLTLVDGRPSFAALSGRLHRGRPSAEAAAATPVTAMVFDLLAIGSADVTREPWTRRREEVERTLSQHGGPHLSLSPVYDDGELLARVTSDQKLEGTIAKRRLSPYLAGVRSRDWLKFPHRAVARLLVGGWAEQGGSSGRLGSLLVGEPDANGALIYRGRVGSGLSERRARQVREQVRERDALESPFIEDLTAYERRGVHWVEPVIAVEVEHLGETDAGRLRQPSLKAVLGG